MERAHACSVSSNELPRQRNAVGRHICQLRTRITATQSRARVHILINLSDIASIVLLCSMPLTAPRPQWPTTAPGATRPRPPPPITPNDENTCFVRRRFSDLCGRADDKLAGENGDVSRIVPLTVSDKDVCVRVCVCVLTAHTAYFDSHICR